MDKSNESNKDGPSENPPSRDQIPLCTNKSKNRGRKRKRRDSGSSSDFEDILPENALEVEKNLHASAIKNNLDDVSVKKILKKVVTNDHVLALVKLREEEEHSTSKEKNPRPKLTRAKAKELMKVSPQSAPWNLDLELTPIKHIPVKTRPEVEALITKELPDDEDDDEYEPTHDDVPSDDDQTLESCSDLDSQPPTPATPTRASRHALSSPLLTDGPFKVPPAKGLLTPARRRLVINDEEEEATIALRTRSKINLSATPIEHIESSFVPPDDVPTPIRDDLWDQFLEECLNPAEVSRHEDDDDADPEYNAAADADAHDEDEEAALDGIIKISKKELNDLVTELFSVMPPDDEIDATLDVLTPTHPTPAHPNELTGHWEGKQEPLSEDENQSDQIKTKPKKILRRDSNTRFSIGKSEPEDLIQNASDMSERDENVDNSPRLNGVTCKKVVRMSVEEQNVTVQPAEEEGGAPPPLLRALRRERGVNSLLVTLDAGARILPEQIQILQQQIRQHVQLAASNFLQLYVNPAHWNMAPAYKEYLVQFDKIVKSNESSVANVCNLKPAVELVRSWEKTVAEDTPENKEMVEFIQNEAERSRRRFHQNSLYVGDFPEMFMKVIANSTVFLYPYLLPAMPYRADSNRKFGYRRSEDELIVLGLDQFWQYIEDNPELFKRPKSLPAHSRWGYTMACTLVSKHMFPWLTPKLLRCRVWRAKRMKDNPIQKFFATRLVTPVTHKLLAYNPKMTLYEQPEHEMPRIWVRYLAKTSQRFRSLYYTRRQTGVQPEGVTVTANIEQPIKNPLPADFTKQITKNRIYKNLDARQTLDVDKAQNTTVIVAKPQNDMFTFGNVPQIATSRVGPILTINPMSATNIINFIRSGHDKNEVILPEGKVPISADVRNSKGIIKAESARNPHLLGKLIPVCVSKLIDPTQAAYTASSVRNNAENVPREQTYQTGKNLTLVDNMFRVVDTSVGAYLVPLTVVQNTNTVNSITGPIVSTIDNRIVGNNLPEASRRTIDAIVENTEELNTHCKCCLLLRKLCKQRQRLITDFFKPNQKEEIKCDCRHRTFPNISRRLKLLVNNYKSKPWCAQKRIEAILESASKTEKRGEEKCGKQSREEYDFEDIAYVSTFQIKLMQRAALARNVYVKKRISKIFSKFDPNTGDPVHLSQQLMDTFGVDLIDMYKEFLGFLTPEQADKVHRFKDYFVHSCIGDLVKKVEEEIHDTDKRNAILTHLNTIFTDNLSTSCEMCFGILSKLTESPRLAKYVFSLFPHRVSRKERDRFQKQKKATKLPIAIQNSHIHSTEVPGQQKSEDTTALNTQTQISKEMEVSSDELIDVDEPVDNLTICDEPSSYVIEYEHSTENSSSEEENTDHADTERSKTLITEQGSDSIKNEGSQQDPGDETAMTDITIGKTEFHDVSESTVMSPLVMSEDEPLKPEHPEWKRDEDKLILEFLLQYLTPQERKEKTILEILEEKNVYHIIAEGLPHKPINDVKDRVMYLLEILVLSEY